MVEAQRDPDPDFPTVPFPNPEEPGALDLALRQARQSSADLVIANDPDGDRLAVAVPDPAVPGGWRALTGDQVGALLGAYLLEQVPPPAGRPGDRLVATTIVSSTLLSRIAAAAGAQYAETLTGFKWIVRAGEFAAGPAFRLRVRGGAGLLRRRGRPGQGRDRRRAGRARPGQPGPGARRVAAGGLRRAGSGARGAPDRAAHGGDARAGAT